MDERYFKAIAMRMDGMTYYQIGLKFNVTAERARQIIIHGERQYEAEKHGVDIRTIDTLLRACHGTQIEAKRIDGLLDYEDFKKQVVSFLNANGCLKAKQCGKKIFNRIEKYLGIPLVMESSTTNTINYGSYKVIRKAEQ